MTATAKMARTPLTREKVLDGAIALADQIGIEAFTIRKLAVELGVKPMTIYHHVPSKNEILDGIVDIVFSEIAAPPADMDWKSAMRQRCVSARKVLARHPWAPPLMESRTSPGPETLRHHDQVLGCLRRGGLSLSLTAHAYAVLDSFVYGFGLQEANLPFDDDDDTVAELTEMTVGALPTDEYPNLVEFTADHFLQPGYSFGASFDFGLDLLLDGIETAASTDQ